MKRTDLLVVVAVWEFLTSLPALIGLALLGALAYPPIIDLSGAGKVGGLVGVSVVVALLLAFFILSVVAGVGLMMRAEWGRIAAIVHAAASLARIPFGTIIGVLVIVYLTRPSVKDCFTSGSPADVPV